MATTYLTVTLHDPVIARDGRPFGTGKRMGSLDWLYPSVLAGSLRTILGNLVQADFSEPDTINVLKEVSIAGPLPLWDGRIFLPAPKRHTRQRRYGREDHTAPSLRHPPHED